jgi:hypothetical protein
MKPFCALCLALLALAGCATPTQMMLDAEVKRLCAIDGGIKVYEMVKLPAEKFNQWGQVNFLIPLKDDAKSGDEYYYEWDIRYYRQGNPELSRGHFKVKRQNDNKLLGESVYYGRGGGDVPGPWHGTSFRCPSDADISILKMRIFVRADKEQGK